MLSYNSMQIMQAVTIIHTSDQELTLEWVSSVSNDMIADSLLALLCGIDSNYATIKRESSDTFARILLTSFAS
jgi:cleavage and polyadenylation specificity factor subunit 3